MIPKSTQCLALAALLATGGTRAFAQERPYFVTYNHQMEEPGSLEIAFNPTIGTQREGETFFSSWLELEYGVKGWWTTELYLDGQTTWEDSTLFTGYRWENRFRPLLHEHRVNPVLYVEYESINGADKTMLEVVGHDGQADHAPPNAEARADHKHEIETKLILSSNVNGWNASANLIAEKNLAGEPWEFGYAAGVSRPLALRADPEPCSLCAENLTAGVEFYGGLGQRRLTVSDTSHYVAPVLAWSPPIGLTVHLSPTFGLNGKSHAFLIRFGIAYEFPRVGRRRPRGVSSPGSAPPALQLQARTDDDRAGRKLFARHCASCHGEAARGGAGVPALDSERVRQAAPPALFAILTNGNLKAGMPSWSRLPDAQRWQLVAFLKTLSPDSSMR